MNRDGFTVATEPHTWDAQWGISSLEKGCVLAFASVHGHRNKERWIQLCNSRIYIIGMMHV